MKKLLAMMLAVLMLFTFAACGDDDDEKDTGKFGGFGGAEDEKDSDYTNDTDIDYSNDYSNNNSYVYDTETQYSGDYSNDYSNNYNNYQSSSSKVEEYINKNKATLLSTMEQSFANSSGMTCTSSIEVVGNGFIINININELNNIDSATKAQMQSAYDSMSATFNGMLDSMQTELPELEYFTINVCEVDGDLLATIRAY